MKTKLKSTREVDGRMPVQSVVDVSREKRTEQETKDRAEDRDKGEDKSPQEEQEFVDGGYGWVIVLSCFVFLMIADGVTLSFGVLYADLVTRYNTNRTAAMWLLSVQTGIRSISGVFVSGLILTYGARVVGVIGSLLLTFGTLMCAHAPNIYILYISYGFINGIGINMLLHTGSVISNHYFRQKRGLATSIISCGSGCGILTFPLMTSYLLDEFGINGTFYLLAGAALQGVVFSFAIIPPSQAFRLKVYHSHRHNWHNLHRHMRKGLTMLFDIGSNFITSSSHLVRTKIADTNHQTPTLNITLPAQHQVSSLKTTKECDTTQGSSHFLDIMKSVLKQAIDVKLLRNPVYLIFCMNSASLRFCTVAPIVLIPARASDIGLSAENGALLVSIVGISSIVGRFCYGLTADRAAVRPYRLYLYVSTFLGAGLVSIVTFGEKFHHQAIYAGSFGFFFGAPFSLRYMVLADLIGIENLVTGSGMLALSDTVFILLGPSVGAWLYEAFGSYNVTYAVLGSSFIFGGAILLLIPLVNKFHQFSQHDNIEEGGEAAAAAAYPSGNVNKAYEEHEKNAQEVQV